MASSHRPFVYSTYRSKGVGAYVEAVTQALEQQNRVEVFTSSALPPGNYWGSVLQPNLERAQAMLVFIDRKWLHHQDQWGRRRIDDPEDWVRREIHHGLEQSLRILPVLVEDAHMPPRQALPEALAELAEIRAVRLRLDRFDEDVQPILEWAASLGSGTRGGLGFSLDEGVQDASDIRLTKLVLRGFRCFDHLELDFTEESTFDGDWTCIVGLNGAGKTSILQAISLLTLGPDYARELGGERLQAMRRRPAETKGAGDRPDCVIQGWFEIRGQTRFLELTWSDRGPQAPALEEDNPWRALEGRTVVAYGASRNLSDSPDRWDGASEGVLDQISLFDPMARLVRADELLQDHPPLRRRFAELLSKLFDEGDLRAYEEKDTVSFYSGGSLVTAHDLPDGFRSSIAWLAHFCARFPVDSPLELKELSGLVLIDEIDLHLHASLQRKIIPKLRAALPNVQFIVTSHSPLIISSFDRNELVLLDRRKPDGLRQLDRQIFTFSTDQVYDWLMGTKPHSAALEDVLEKGPREGLSALLYQSPEIDEDEALEKDARHRAILQEMGFGDGS